jgi:hypothetical protein
VVDPTVNVSVDEPEPGALMDAGLNAAVTPAGIPEAVNDIAELKLPVIAVLSVLVPFAPSAAETEAGEAAIVNAGGAGTVRLTFEVWVIPPPEPVTEI